MRLILWDIDGTLLRTGPPAREAIESAVAAVAGIHALPDVSMSGKTDPQIVRELFTLAGVADVEAMVPLALQAVEDELRQRRERLIEEGRVLPGVVDVLARLDREPGVVQSVLTGNMVANARLKLDAFGLDGYVDLDVGAFGSDDADRTRLVPIALSRARERLGAEPEDVWVVGDTEHDLACARAGGVRCALVGTGRPGWDAVRALDADAAFPDLADTEAVVGALLSSPAAVVA